MARLRTSRLTCAADNCAPSACPLPSIASPIEGTPHHMVNDKRDRMRRRFIDATLENLAERGYAETSLRTIARAAGVTAALLPRYFAGKRALMIESYRQFKTEALKVYLLEAASAGPDPARRLEAFIRSVFLYNARRGTKHMRVWVSFLELVMTDEEVAKIQAEIYDVFIGEFVGALTRIYAERGESLSVDSARDLAIGINSVMDGLWLECSLNPSRIGPEEALRLGLNLIGPRIGVTFFEPSTERDVPDAAAPNGC